MEITLRRKLTGWKAIAVVVASLGFVIFKFNFQNEALKSEGVEVVKRWLILESVRAVLPDMEKTIKHATQNEQSLEQIASNLKEENFEIVSVSRRGVGERIVARVEVRYKGQAPPDGKNVRYLKMEYSMVTGWRVKRETSAWYYYTRFF